MVSAKFHLIGEDSEWFRIRLQEEIHAHGVEGTVLSAGGKTLAIVLEGDKSRIKRMHTDVADFLPEGVERSDLRFSVQTRHMRIAQPGRTEEGRLEYILQYLKEIEKAVQRIDQKVNTLIAQHEGYGGAEILSRSSLRGEEGFEYQNMEVDEDASSGFAAMFGD